MKISYNWLSDYIDLSGISIADLSELLSTRVAEVDSFWEVGSPLRGAIAGKIIAIRPLNDKHAVATVDLKKSKIEVVCSIANGREGIVVPYIPLGEKFFDGKELSEAGERDFAGFKSKGLLASARDLELYDEHLGIYELNDIPVGESLEKHLGGIDYVIEIDNKSLTHRPDLWSHFGFAQELSAVLKRPLKLDLGKFADCYPEGQKSFSKLKEGKAEVKLEVEPSTKLKRMIACRIDNVSVVQSPEWMKRRLFAIGAGVRNFLIDLSNYLMHDMGQPNHLFDRASIKPEEISIRSARKGETIKTLDGKVHQLISEDMVIADSERALDLGGVMGGHDTSVEDTTKSVLFTAGTFDPVLVRKSSTRHQVRSDGSQRYEKSLSPYLSSVALQRFLQLLSIGCPDAKIVGAVSDAFPSRPEPIKITLSAELLQQRLGEGAPSFKESTEILKRLRLKFLDESANSCTVEVPYDRATKDISIPADLVEEVGRVWGYENIHERAPKIASLPSKLTPLREIEIEMQASLRGLGFNEISNYSFIKPEYSESLGFKLDDGIFMENPIDETQGALRTSLIPGMLERVIENAKFQTSLQIFELGRGYHKSPIEKFKDYKTIDRFKNLASYEQRFLTLGLLVDKSEQQAVTPKVKAGSEFYALVEVAKRVCAEISPAEVTLAPYGSGSPKWMHPYRAAKVFLGCTEVGVIAECNPQFTKDLKGRVVFCELECDTLLELKTNRKYAPTSKFPTSLFEISVVAPVKDHYSAILKLLTDGIPKEQLRVIDLLDVYQGKPLPDDKKSVSVRVVFGAQDRTLTGDELSKLQDNLMAHIEKNSYAIRR